MSVDDELDQIFFTINGLIDANDFERINNIFDNIQISDMDETVITCYLAASHLFKDKISSYTDFYNRCKKHFTDSLGPEETFEVLHGFEP